MRSNISFSIDGIYRLLKYEFNWLKKVINSRIQVSWYKNRPKAVSWFIINQSILLPGVIQNVSASFSKLINKSECGCIKSTHVKLTFWLHVNRKDTQWHVILRSSQGTNVSGQIFVYPRKLQWAKLQSHSEYQTRSVKKVGQTKGVGLI